MSLKLLYMRILFFDTYDKPLYFFVLHKFLYMRILFFDRKLKDFLRFPLIFSNFRYNKKAYFFNNFHKPLSHISFLKNYINATCSVCSANLEIQMLLSVLSKIAAIRLYDCGMPTFLVLPVSTAFISWRSFHCSYFFF